MTEDYFPIDEFILRAMDMYTYEELGALGWNVDSPLSDIEFDVLHDFINLYMSSYKVTHLTSRTGKQETEVYVKLIYRGLLSIDKYEGPSIYCKPNFETIMNCVRNNYL